MTERCAWAPWRSAAARGSGAAPRGERGRGDQQHGEHAAEAGFWSGLADEELEGLDGEDRLVLGEHNGTPKFSSASMKTSSAPETIAAGRAAA